MLEDVEANDRPSQGTWRGAYDGVTGYLTHEAGRTDSSRLSSLWFGANEATNRRALQLATDMAGGA